MFEVEFHPVPSFPLMKHTRYTLWHSLLLIGAGLLLPNLVQAQGWQRFHGGIGNDRAFALQLLPGGSMVVAGSTTDSLGINSDFYFFSADSLGHLTDERRWGLPTDDETALTLIPGVNNDWFLGGTQFHPTPNLWGFEPKAHLLHLDSAYNLLNGYAYNSFTAFNQGKSWNQDLLLAGAKYVPYGPDSYVPRFYFQKIDTAGATIWEKDLDFGEYSEAEFVLPLPNGDAFISGSFFEVSNLYDLVIQKINPLGDSLASLQLNLPGNQASARLLLDNSGKLLLVGSTGISSAEGPDILLSSFSQNLDSLWTRFVVLPGSQQAHAALLLPNGKLAIAGEHIPEGSNSRDGFLAVVDTLGNLLWFKTYGGLKGDIIWDMQPAPDGNGFLLAGQTASFGASGDIQAWLLRTDSTGTVWSNQLVGHVKRDVIENCVIDPTEPALPGWFVAASGATGTLYTLTDSLGAYSMGLDTGSWFVSVLPPSGYWSACEDSIQVDILQLGDTLAVDLQVQTVYDCPLLDVDLTTPYLRRCFENTYTVRYYNYGTSTAPDAVITIELDPYLTATGSTLPYTQSGDTLIFSVGVVKALSGGTFQFSALLDCDSTVLGQTHCTEAHIYPDSLCFDFNPEWDGAHLEVDGYCMGDSVRITITNTGLGMQGSVNYIITEDQIIFKLSMLQLDAGQDTSFVIYPGGSTVTIMVQQTSGHPGNSQPILVIEGCGGFPFSTGYALQFPQNDGDFSTDIECRQNIGSFDPNDKIGLPEGVGGQHVISPETTIEYLIRFQNTGTDTAFRVAIIDTLPATLEVASFREGASSHPYQLGISETGILQFLFDPIALPDSGANWTNSQGFVKFKIAPKKGLALGTAIQNRASIYFDQNTPVHTAQTLHTLGNPIQHLTTPSTEPVNTNTTTGMLITAPNPTLGNILVTLAQPLGREGLRLAVKDALGRELQYYNHFKDTEPYSVDLSALPSGMYLLELKNHQGFVIAVEKLIKI